MSFYEPPPPPPTGLARYRLLSPTAGVHVSPIQLGAMSIGDRWSNIGMGSMDKESSFKLLDAYYDGGGNFIDTANNYQDGSSEEFIGEWAEKRGIRDQLFIATKASSIHSSLTFQPLTLGVYRRAPLLPPYYPAFSSRLDRPGPWAPELTHTSTQYTNNFRLRDPTIVDHKILFAGNNAKSLKVSFKKSLERLRTDYVDLLYVHWWDWDTSIEEVMKALHTLVLQGKVLYLGISDSPAWVVAKANAYARAQGLTPFVIYQGAWNVLERSFEREIIPLARAEGLALAPWNVLAGGRFRTDAEEQKRLESGENGRTVFSGGAWLRTDTEKAVCSALEKIAEEVGAKHITSVAIAYVLQKAPFVFPIIGGRKVEHLHANLEALDITLTDEHIKALESVVPFNPGFPNNMIGDGTEYRAIWSASGVLDRQPLPAVIKPPTGTTSS